MQTDFLENYSGGFDLPDSRDYTADELDGFGGNSAENLPKKFFLQNVVNHEQGNIGACTLFGSVNAFNETAKNIKISLDRTWEIWAEAKKRWATDNNGWYLQFALQLLKDLGEIKGYIRLDLAGFASAEKIKKALVQGKAVVTGVAKWNWSEIIKTHEYKKTNRNSGHIFDIVWYDDDYEFADGEKWGFYVENSWGNKWYFWFKYADIGELYSQYIFEDVAEIKKVRKNANLQKAFEHKIWNEERPTDKATASEIRVMVNRALNLGDNYVWLRKMIHHLVNDKIIRGKILNVFAGRDYDKASDEEFAIMFSRAVTRNANLNELVLTREQVAEVVGRDFL